MDGGVDLETGLHLFLEGELDESSAGSFFETSDKTEMDEELMALAALHRVWPDTHEENSGLWREVGELLLHRPGPRVGLLVDVSHSRSFPSFKKRVN